MCFFVRYCLGGLTVLSIWFSALGCMGETTIHKMNLTREEALVLVDFPLPASTTNIFYYEEVGGLQSLKRFVRFDFNEEELHSAVDAIITSNNAKFNRNLAFERRELSMVPEEEKVCPQRLAKEAELYWWNPRSITNGYYRGELDSYAVRMWIDEGVRFKLTESSFKELRNKGVPAEVLESLKTLKDKEFILKNELLDALENQIGKEQTNTYKDLILKYADEGIRRIYLYQSD